MHNQNLQTAFLRVALAAGFLSAVADRLGMWGLYGRPTVAWGDMQHFLPYVAKLNPWLPVAMVPPLGWLVTIAETVLGILLLVGWQTRWAARLSGFLLLAFAAGMAIGTGVKTALDASVFAASAGAFMLATARRYAWSVDELILVTDKRHE
jgi:thiosulfate dehydrogenase (quinone) large subunit